ncbi:HTH-type transcriptional regulator GltC [Paraconexibacter sp. AEG42_29]|uniref:HTH-type transcriptional regulator GltC n=1 Tax=Paraconexibacter sp. AEG42_29 TaxID=2997339 RepID=A0AAU7B0H9_9ACTN
MDLRQLESFVCVARHGHITRAARELFVTQPALSQQIRRLERELGVVLLTRTATGVELTPAGADLAQRAQRILADVAQARGAMDDHAGVHRGVARVAAATGDAHGLPAALASFHAAHPEVRLALRQGSEHEVLALLAQGAVDLVVTSQPAPPGTSAVAVGDQPLVVAAVAGDDLIGTGGGPVAVSALRERILILGERGTALRGVVVAACQAAGFSPVPLLEISGAAAVLTLVRAGLGVAVVPAAWVAGADGIATAAVTTTGGSRLTLGTTLVRGGELGPAAALLEAHLLSALR